MRVTHTLHGIAFASRAILFSLRPRARVPFPSRYVPSSQLAYRSALLICEKNREEISAERRIPWKSSRSSFEGLRVGVAAKSKARARLPAIIKQSSAHATAGSKLNSFSLVKRGSRWATRVPAYCRHFSSANSCIGHTARFRSVINYSAHNSRNEKRSAERR